MGSYGQYCPIAKGAELLGDRWTLLICRELLFGPIRFNEFQRGLPGISRSVLANRLRRLELNRIITKGQDGYGFSDAGELLRPVLRALGNWVGEWVMDDPAAAESDAELLMLYLSRHVNSEALPAGKTIYEFRFAGETSTFWLILEPREVSVCVEDPCLPVAVTVTGSATELYRVYMGRNTLRRSIGEGAIKLDGLQAEKKRFADVMAWSSFAPAVSVGLAKRQGDQ